MLHKREKQDPTQTPKLENEKDKSARKQLEMEVRIIALQRKKGSKRRKELQEKCK